MIKYNYVNFKFKENEWYKNRIFRLNKYFKNLNKNYSIHR